jgi:type IV secretion system protein VirB10
MSEPNSRDVGGRAVGIADGGSVVSDRPARQLTAIQKIGVAGLVAVVFISFIWIEQLNKKTQDVKQPDLPLTAGGAFRPVPQMAAAPVALPMPLPAPAASATQALFGPPQQHEMTPSESPIFAFSGGGGTGGLVDAALESAPSPASVVSAIGDSHAGQETALGNRLKPTVLAGAKARLLPHPDMMVTEGTIIPCTLQTAIDSQLAGFVKCVLPQSVRSTTGNVVLLDRGTTVVGEIQAGLMQGQNRVFVLWDRAETPDHAVIQLASPGTDELGRSGLPGRVNNHFWERFGGAILLSVVQGSLNAGTALAANAGGATGGTFFNSFQSNGSSVADTALQASINIPPTLEKNQGDNIAIFVAHDLDFSDVYNLRVTGSPYGQ